MRGKLAKQLRKEVFDNKAQQREKLYIKQKRKGVETGAIINNGARGLYLNLKKTIKEVRSA